MAYYEAGGVSEFEVRDLQDLQDLLTHSANDRAQEYVEATEASDFELQDLLNDSSNVFSAEASSSKGKERARENREADGLPRFDIQNLIDNSSNAFDNQAGLGKGKQRAQEYEAIGVFDFDIQDGMNPLPLRLQHFLPKAAKPIQSGRIWAIGQERCIVPPRGRLLGHGLECNFVGVNRGIFADLRMGTVDTQERFEVVLEHEYTSLQKYPMFEYEALEPGDKLLRPSKTFRRDNKDSNDIADQLCLMGSGIAEHSNVGEHGTGPNLVVEFEAKYTVIMTIKAVFDSMGMTWDVEYPQFKAYPEESQNHSGRSRKSGKDSKNLNEHDKRFELVTFPQILAANVPQRGQYFRLNMGKEAIMHTLEDFLKHKAQGEPAFQLWFKLVEETLLTTYSIWLLWAYLLGKAIACADESVKMSDFGEPLEVDLAPNLGGLKLTLESLIVKSFREATKEDKSRAFKKWESNRTIWTRHRDQNICKKMEPFDPDRSESSNVYGYMDPNKYEPMLQTAEKDIFRPELIAAQDHEESLLGHLENMCDMSKDKADGAFRDVIKKAVSQTALDQDPEPSNCQTEEVMGTSSVPGSSIEPNSLDPGYREIDANSDHKSNLDGGGKPRR